MSRRTTPCEQIDPMTELRAAYASNGRWSWETWIRDLVNDFGWLPLTRETAIAFGRPLTRSEYNGLTRAARRLADRGEIGLMRVLERSLSGRENVQLVAIRSDLIESLRERGARVRGGATVPTGTVAPVPHGDRRLPGSLRSIARVAGVSKTTVWRWYRERPHGGEP